MGQSICKPKETIALAIAPVVIKQIDKVAKLRGISRSEFLRSLILRYFKEWK